MKDGASSGRRVVSNSIVYTVCGLLQKCFSFFLLPLYTTYLTTADYGITSIASSFMGTMSILVAFSLYAAVSRFYVDYKHSPETLSRFYGTVVVFTFLSGLVFGTLLTLFRGTLCRYVFAGVDYYPVVLVCLVSLLFNCQYTIYTNILRSQQKAMKSSILSLLYFLVSLCLNIFFVVGLHMGAVGVLLSTLIASFLYTVYFLVDMGRKKEIRLCLDRKLLKAALKYSIPIMPHNLSTLIAQLVSNVLIGGTGTLGTLGVYSIAVQFGNIADTIQVYVDSAYGPWLYEKLHSREEGYQGSVRRVAAFLAAVIGLFMLGVGLFAQDYILLFLEKSYQSAWHFVPWVVLVFAVKTMYYFYVEVLFYYKKASRLLFIATITGSLVNVLLSAMLIPLWGVYGSIAADGIAMVIRVTIVVFISSRFDDVGLKLRDFLENLGIVAAFLAAGLAPSFLWGMDTFSPVNFIYKGLVVLGYIAVQFLLHRKTVAVYAGQTRKRFRKK